MKLFIKLYSSHENKLQKVKLLLDFLSLTKSNFNWIDITKNNKFMYVYQISDKNHSFLNILAKFMKEKKLIFYYDVRE